MGRKSETGGVTPLGDRIQVRFTWKGKELRPTLDMKPTAPNLKHAKRIRESIVQDIKAGVFNLAEYFPDYKFADKHSTDVLGRTFKEWADKWAELQARDMEDSTLRIYKRHLTAYWVVKFGGDLPKAITHERLLVHLAYLSKGDDVTKQKPLSRKTQNNILIPLRGVFSMICRADPLLRNPTDGIDNAKVQAKLPDPFDVEEVEVILSVLKRDFGEETADYFEFAFFAGLRNSEQIALLWPDVDFRKQHTRIHRSRVLAKDKERTKTGYARDVELNARAFAVLERQRARTQLKGDHVFRNPTTGKPWNDEQEQRRIWVKALRTAKVRYRPPKECRDTSVTMALVAGADPLWVATQHGHSLAVMLRDYARWIPKADRGRNIKTVNESLGFRINSAVNSAGTK